MAHLICPICYKNLDPEDVSLLKCGHTGHKTCLHNKWLEEKDEFNMVQCHSCPSQFQPSDLQNIHLKFQLPTEVEIKDPNLVQPSHKTNLEGAIQNLSINKEENPRSISKEPDGSIPNKKNNDQMPSSIPQPVVRSKKKKSITEKKNNKNSPRNTSFSQPPAIPKQTKGNKKGHGKAEHKFPIPLMKSLPPRRANTHVKASLPSLSNWNAQGRQHRNDNPAKSHKNGNINWNQNVIIGKNNAMSWGSAAYVTAYIGRVSPDVSSNDVRMDIAAKGINIIQFEENFTCHSRFKSFKVILSKKDFDSIYAEDKWPEGVTFRRFCYN